MFGKSIIEYVVCVCCLRMKGRKIQQKVSNADNEALPTKRFLAASRKKNFRHVGLITFHFLDISTVPADLQSQVVIRYRRQ